LLLLLLALMAWASSGGQEVLLQCIKELGQCLQDHGGRF
jgi:hypothetical protein